LRTRKAFPFILKVDPGFPAAPAPEEFPAVLFADLLESARILRERLTGLKEKNFALFLDFEGQVGRRTRPVLGACLFVDRKLAFFF